MAKKISEIAKMSSEDIQKLVYNVDDKGNNLGYLSDSQLDVLAKNAKDIDDDAEVIAAKSRLENAKIDAYYAKDSDTAADSDRTMTLILRKVVSGLGYKWDNKEQRFSDGGQPLFCNLWACATDSLSHTKAIRHNGADEKPCMLRSVAEISGWLKDTCAEYVRSLSSGRKAKKNVADQVKSYYQGCIDFDDTPEIATAKAAKKYDLTEEQVKSYIK